MNTQEIMNAVDSGKTVYWDNSGYIVGKWADGYNIVCQENQHAIGLTHIDKVTLNGKESDFYIKRK
jgi:hypothetical protein